MRKINRCTLSLLFFALASWSVSCAFAENVDIRIIQKEYNLRQQNILGEITDRTERVNIERAAALLFLNRRPPQTNLILRAFDHQKASSLQCTIPIRILCAHQNNLCKLDETVLIHLRTEMTQWIRSRSLENSTSIATKHSPESSVILDLSTLMLWAKYVEDATLGYKWPDKKSNQIQQTRFNQEIYQWLDQKSRYGFNDCSSSELLDCIGALLNIHDWCDDPILETKSAAVIDLVLSDIVQESLAGQWGGVRGRVANSNMHQDNYYINYILFGLPVPDNLQPSFDAVSLNLSLSKYRPPGVLVKLMREYDDRGTYESANFLYANNRNKIAEDANGLKKYSYVTPSYILSSFQLRSQTTPWHSRPWDLLVLDENNFGHHLFAFTGNELISGGKQAAQDEYYLWNSTCFQYKNVLFNRYHRCDRVRLNLTDSGEFLDDAYVQWPTRIWIPNTFAPVIQDQSWCFSEVGAIYLAFRPLKGRSYWWRTTELDPRTGSGSSILTFQNLYTSFLLEIESASNFISFDQFMNQVINSPLKIDNDSVTFVSRRGDVFLFPLDEDEILVNGNTIETLADSSNKLFNSPFIQSEYGSGVLDAQWKGYSLHLDLRDSEKPIRVVKPN